MNLESSPATRRPLGIRMDLLRRMAGLAVAVTPWLVAAQSSQSVPVPNSSFETPATFYVSTVVGSWQKVAKPAYFDENALGYFWTQTAGLFLNTPSGASDRIDNVDGRQVSYLLAYNQVTLFQDLSSPAQTYQPGQSYTLTLGLFGKNMPAGNILSLRLYYRDAANNRVTVASNSVVYSVSAFPSTTHLVDYSVSIPAVRSSDPWSGKIIGVEIQSVQGTGVGYWDVDNVRLVADFAVDTPLLPIWALVATGLCVVVMGVYRWK